MDAQYLTIERKHRQMTGFLASLADFTYTEGEAVVADVVCTTPTISLYCLDAATQRAIFVELPPAVNLATVPFVYQTQYEQAQRLIAVPYATFRQLAHALPAVPHLIVLYISGRSGSTLVSHLLNAVDGVVSLSEPDVATQFVHLRHTHPDGAADLRALLDSTVRFLFKPGVWGTPARCALKLRNEGLQVMDLFQATFPQATNLYLYRDAWGFVASFARIFRRAGMPDPLPLDAYLALFGQIFARDLSDQEAYLEAGTTMLSLPQLLTLWWLAGMEWYLAQHAQGLPILAVRYDDLNVQREPVVRALLDYCGLPPLPGPALLGVFGRDAQAGTGLARENPAEGNQARLSAEDREEMARILRRHPVVKTADFVVPGTLQV